MGLEQFSRQDRVKTPRHHIDPGFINHRLIFSTLGHQFREFYESKRSKKDDHMSRLRNDHLLVTCLLTACHNSNVRTLGEVLQAPSVGILFCSTEKIKATPGVYDEERVSSRIILSYKYDKEIRLNYSTKHIWSDTGRNELHQGAYLTIVAGIRDITSTQIIAYPLVMGAPSFDHVLNRDLGLDLAWYGLEWYEIYPGDIDEFSKMNEIKESTPEEWQNEMKSISEKYIKHAICEILRDVPRKDWGGELNDHFTTSMHLSGERVTGALLLKGPANFREMTLRHLGKNADQIFHLAAAPAQVLVVQHAHNIGEAVRATLRAFAVNPANPRRYCLIDGKDAYKLLKAYGKLSVRAPTDKRDVS